MRRAAFHLLCQAVWSCPVSFMVGAGVVVVLSSVGLGVGIGESEGEASLWDLESEPYRRWSGRAPGVGVGVEPGVGDGDVDDVALEMTVCASECRRSDLQ